MNDFYRPRAEEEVGQIANLFCQLMMLAYREAKKVDPTVAEGFLNSFVSDYPGVDGSCLYSKWESLAQAVLAFKGLAKNSADLSQLGKPMAWEITKNVVMSYNEFFNGLLGYLIVCWRCGLGKKVKPNVFNNAYGSKLNDFADLTGGDDGAFYLIFRLANVDVRNAIAHGNIWYDESSQKIKYIARKDVKTQHEINLVEFFGWALAASHLLHAYLAAVAAVAIYESGNDVAKSLIPQHLIKLMQA